MPTRGKFLCKSKRFEFHDNEHNCDAFVQKILDIVNTIGLNVGKAKNADR